MVFGPGNSFTSFDESSLTFEFNDAKLTDEKVGSYIILVTAKSKGGAQEIFSIDVLVQPSDDASKSSQSAPGMD